MVGVTKRGISWFCGECEPPISGTGFSQVVHPYTLGTGMTGDASSPYIREYTPHTWGMWGILTETRMWANAQRNGCPAKYRWRPLFNAANDAHYTRVTCSNAGKTRNPLTLAAVPQTNETIPAASGPKFSKDTWGRHCCLTSFFRLSIRA